MYGVLWVAQAISGVLLLVLLGIHLLVNHTESGMLDYQAVVARFKNPVTFTIETVFLLVVIFHAFNGVRGVLLDYVRSERLNRLVSRGLAGLGVAAAAYGLWLSLSLRAR